jgi:ketosteroid isomerase-like protein
VEEMAFSGPGKDRAAIQELNAAYGDAISCRDKEAYANVWAENAIWYLPWGDPIHGRETIASTWYSLIEPVLTEFYISSVGALDVKGDSATGRVWTMERVLNKDGVLVTVCGRYDDVYIRDEGSWRYLTRKFLALSDLGPLL